MTTAQRNRFIDLAGGTNAKILVVPFASSTPEEAGLITAESYRNRGIDADYVSFNRGEADLQVNLSKLDGVTGIWFTGGSQTLLRDMLIGTVFVERMLEIYRKGGVIGGLSAGAAIMSKKMMAYGNISEGFGFIDFAIIDQHFSERERQSRLLIAVEDHCQAGIGIDEATAVLFSATTQTFEVLGNGTVTVYVPRTTGMITQIFRNGEKFTKEFLTLDLVSMSPDGIFGMGLADFTTSKTVVSQGESFTVNYRLRNFSSARFEGGLAGAALIDNNENIVAVIGTRSISNLNANATAQNLRELNCRIPETVSPGQYTLKIVIKPTGKEEWRILVRSVDGISASIDFQVLNPQ
jgi:cyanophycinase